MKKIKQQQGILPKIVVILGPTASGKSAIAVKLALKFYGEIVSADSRQIYRGLDIGTGKIKKGEMRGVPHHLLDVVSPHKQFSVIDYVNKARKAIKNILSRGRLPIITGGTGFYIDALLGDITPAPVPQNKELRTKLEKEDIDVLFRKFQKIDPLYAQKIDRKNKRRIIRAIEIVKAVGKMPDLQKTPHYNVLKIGVSLQTPLLKEKIAKRLKERIKQGMIAEAKRLHNQPAGVGLSYKRMEALGLEYRFLAHFLKKEITEEKMLEQLETAIWQYAKRQLTYWKRDAEIHWFSPNDYNPIKQTILSFLR